MCLDAVLGISLTPHSCPRPPGCRRDYRRRNVKLTIQCKPKECDKFYIRSPFVSVLQWLSAGKQKLKTPNKQNAQQMFIYYTVKGKGKGKAVPLQAWSDPEGSRKLRFPDFVTTAQDGGKVVSLTYSWYSFLLEAESAPGPQRDRKDFISMKNSIDTSWDRTSDLPICSTAP